MNREGKKLSDRPHLRTTKQLERKMSFATLLLSLLLTLSSSISIRSPPGAIIVKRLVQLKQHAADDLHNSDNAWNESSSMCQTTTDLLLQEAEQALRRKNEIETKIAVIQKKFNGTSQTILLKRKAIVQMGEKIDTITTGELQNAKDKLQQAMEKLSKAIEAAKPENSRLTLAIEKTQRIITSIKQNTAAAAGVDTQEAEAQTETDATDASTATALLEIDTIPDAEDVGPRFVAAIVKLNDLKVQIETLRNNSMELYNLKKKRAESQMNYAKDIIIKIATNLNATKSDLKITRTTIVAMDVELKNLTAWEQTLNERLTFVVDNYRRSNEASEEMKTFCKHSHDDYREGRSRASGIGSLVDELTEMTTSRMAHIQEHIIESKMDVLNTAVAKSKQEIPSSYNRLFDNVRGQDKR